MQQDTASLVANSLGAVPGIVAIVLGGSRARGTAGPSSDYDVGLYSRSDKPINIAALRQAVAQIVDDPAMSVTEHGEWGPWIDGGGWLVIGGVEVDLLYRSIDRVEEVYSELERGSFRIDYQVGHPHGFCSAILAGEAAIARPLLDPTGAFSALKGQVSHYPPALAAALIARFGWEVSFAIETAHLAARRTERTHVIGCIYRAVCCVAQVLFALNRQYVINEKGALAAAANLPVTLPQLEAAVNEIWCAAGCGDLETALARMTVIERAMRDLIGKH